VLVRERECLRAVAHRAVLGDEFGDHPDLLQSGDLQKVNCRLGMTGTNQGVPDAGLQGEHVTGSPEVVGSGERVGESTDGSGS
jgi:hypothetical protein